MLKKHYLYIYIKKHKKIEQNISFLSYLVSFNFVQYVRKLNQKKKPIFNIHKIFNILVTPFLLFVKIVHKELKTLSLLT